ncbi:hypothetical protein BU15DRAFT_74451 [Melanogaster broomeanus]|nr:hypothetical protein BU15DRAFT_74451 [Melanogaster broomeanus]
MSLNIEPTSLAPYNRYLSTLSPPKSPGAYSPTPSQHVACSSTSLVPNYGAPQCSCECPSSSAHAFNAYGIPPTRVKELPSNSDDIHHGWNVDHSSESLETVLSSSISPTLSTNHPLSDTSHAFSEFASEDLSARPTDSRHYFLYPLHEPGERIAKRTQRLRARTAAVLRSLPATVEDITDHSISSFIVKAKTCLWALQTYATPSLMLIACQYTLHLSHGQTYLGLPSSSTCSPVATINVPVLRPFLGGHSSPHPSLPDLRRSPVPLSSHYLQSLLTLPSTPQPSKKRILLAIHPCIVPVATVVSDKRIARAIMFADILKNPSGRVPKSPNRQLSEPPDEATPQGRAGFSAIPLAALALSL